MVEEVAGLWSAGLVGAVSAGGDMQELVEAVCMGGIGGGSVRGVGGVRGGSVRGVGGVRAVGW